MGRHSRTLEQIFSTPTPANIPWREMESLFSHYGQVFEAEGSRVNVLINGVVLHLHKPHPEKEASRSMVKDVRRFLENAGITP